MLIRTVLHVTLEIGYIIPLLVVYYVSANRVDLWVSPSIRCNAFVPS